MDKATYTYEALQQKYVNFITPALEVTIGSTTYSSREIPILNLEVELNADGSAGGCSFTVDSQYKAEASKWKNDFDKSVKAGAKLAVKGGYVKMEEIFYGYIDEYSFVYNGNEGPRIEITGIDGLGYLMSMREPLYAGQRQAKNLVEDILGKSVAKGYAKSATVGLLSGFQKLKTPIIKEQIDDWSFLNLLAGRYGASLFAVDGELIFDDVASDTKPLIKLAVGAGLRSFTKRVSLAHQVGRVEVWGRDVNQKPIRGTADTVTIGGAAGQSAAKLAPALQSAVLREYSEYARTQEECELMAQNRLNGIAMGLVSGEGACIGIPELIPGRYIEIDGLDSSTNGSYFVSRVKHRFDSEGYSTTFEVKGAKTK